jgi:hypothetical protein
LFSPSRLFVLPFLSFYFYVFSNQHNLFAAFYCSRHYLTSPLLKHLAIQQGRRQSSYPWTRMATEQLSLDKAVVMIHVQQMPWLNNPVFQVSLVKAQVWNVTILNHGRTLKASSFGYCITNSCTPFVKRLACCKASSPISSPCTR